MPPNLPLVLQITLIGMSLVFGAILLFWALMAALVRVTTEREPAPAPAAAPAESPDQALRAQAAALAVTAALALAATPATSAAVFQPPAPAGVSAWQAVMRANQLSQRGPVR